MKTLGDYYRKTAAGFSLLPVSSLLAGVSGGQATRRQGLSIAYQPRKLGLVCGIYLHWICQRKLLAKEERAQGEGFGQGNSTCSPSAAMKKKLTAAPEEAHARYRCRALPRRRR